jgi:transposase InsO family protein
MVRLGVISQITEPTEWCAGMVPVPKKNGTVRICVDLTRLNQSVKRERHQLPAVEQVLAQLSGAKKFTKLDANSGFWQIPLAPESTSLTTFTTPFGRYQFHRLPFGITSAPEHFQRRMEEVLRGTEGNVCMIDDILVFGKDQEDHDKNLVEALKKIEEAGLTLNKEKCEFSKDRVTFLGQVIDSSGVHPDPDKVSAIKNIPAPQTVSEVRRFLGMANQMGKFVPNLADMTKPLRDLLCKDHQWIWDHAQQTAFESVKTILSSTPVLVLYDPNARTIVSADSSSYGLGATLLQEQTDGNIKPVAYISRSLSPVEERYAQIEKEALAFTWACERFSDFLIGINFCIQTDHKPLVPLFSTKNLEELPVRVQRFRIRMLRFDFNIIHVPGKNLIIADALSRAPEHTPSEKDLILQEDTRAYINLVMESHPASEHRLKQIELEQKKDPTCVTLAHYCTKGWPRKSTLSGQLKKYYSLASEISVIDGLLMRNSRIIIPTSLRKQVLNQIHTGHQGLNKCRHRARQSVWWPGISKELQEIIENCRICRESCKQRAEPMIPSAFPSLPWQKVGMDLFEFQKTTYLLVVDYYSRFIEIAKLSRLTTEEVVLHCKSIFARHGIPEEIISDNGPQFISESFSEFSRKYHFRHITSSPYHPISNGEAERAVGTIKSLLKKAEDPYLAILAYRVTPLPNGYSPSQLLMGRILRSTVPSSREIRKPSIPDSKSLIAREKQLREKQKRNFDRRHGVRELPVLTEGDLVWLSDRKERGTVGEQIGPRSYEVETPSGSFRRNRRSLVTLPQALEETQNIPTQSTDGLQDVIQTEIESTETNVFPTVPATPIARRSTRITFQPNRYDPSAY